MTTGIKLSILLDILLHQQPKTPIKNLAVLNLVVPKSVS